MSGYYEVELEALSELIQRLSTAHDEMSAALDTLSNANTTQTGSDALTSACGGFHDTWQYGLKQLAGATGDVTEKLKATQQTYSETENQITEVMNRVGGGLNVRAA